MKNLDLSTYGVEEMNQQEMLNEYGGSLIGWLAASVAFAFCWDTLNDLEGTGNAIRVGKEKAFNQF